MARARNIKPGFFQNEDLVELPYEYRLLFIGLWTLADKEGRLEDRPKKIKMGVFPADDADVEAGLSALAGRKFITRYEVGGQRYIQVANWNKHQSPHHTERPSVIPPLNNGDVTDEPQKDDGGNPPDSLIHRFTDSPIPTDQPSTTTQASVATEPEPGNPPSPPSPEVESRAETLAARARKLEGNRGKRCSIHAKDPRVVRWAEAGISDPDFREAYELAVAERMAADDPSPINAGFLDIFIAKLANPRDSPSAVSVEGARPEPKCCWFDAGGNGCDGQVQGNVSGRNYCGKHFDFAMDSSNFRRAA